MHSLLESCAGEGYERTLFYTYQLLRAQTMEHTYQFTRLSAKLTQPLTYSLSQALTQHLPQRHISIRWSLTYRRPLAYSPIQLIILIRTRQLTHAFTHKATQPHTLTKYTNGKV
jgi:hypothetical protein